MEPIKTRLLSLDIFRGITIAGMIVVNTPGSWSHVYPPLLHAEWHGVTPTDLVFPFFLFIVGMAVFLSLKKHQVNEAPGEVYKRIIKRALILVLLGLFLNLFPKFDFLNIRIPGVLQRIGIVYGISAILFLKTSLKTQIKIAISILVGYCVLLLAVPVPGTGEASMTVESNLPAWLDYLLLKGHTWKATWDPEGILSTLPAIVTCQLGIFTAAWLFKDGQNREDTSRITWLIIAGNLALFVALVWNLFFPINKALWTSSYVLYAGGLAVIVLTILYWLVDVKKIMSEKAFFPFIVMGVNPITAYMISETVTDILYLIKVPSGEEGQSLYAWIYENVFSSILSPMNASLAFSLCFLGIFIFLPTLWMYRKKIIIKI